MNQKILKKNKTGKQILIAYGESYTTILQNNLGKSHAREQLIEAGKRALSYFVKASAFDKVHNLVTYLVNDNPHQSQTVITDLQTIIKQGSEKELNWVIYCNLADALRRSGQIEFALPFYLQAISQAEITKDWLGIGSACHNYAIALQIIGDFSQAKKMYHRAIEAKRKASRPESNVLDELEIMGSELEMFRIDIIQRKAQQVLPEIEQRLTEARKWWSYHQEKKILTPFAVEFLVRFLIGGLDIAREAHFSLKNWEKCLNLSHEIEQLEQRQGYDKHTLAITKLNRYSPLMAMGYLDEAQRLLEECLQIYQEVGDVTRQARSLSALADIWTERGDLSRAIELEKQTLSLREQLENPEDRAISHGSLSNSLYKQKRFQESASHRLAQLVYYLITDNQQGLSHCLSNLVIDTIAAIQTATVYSLPQLNELLNISEFKTLSHFLPDRNINPDELQIKINELLEQVQKAVSKKLNGQKTDSAKK